MKKIFAVLMFALILMVNIPSYGQQVTKVGTTVANFLSIETGARAVAMGGAYVAIAEGPISMFWNPAGIARSDKAGVVFSNTNWLLDIEYNFAGLTIPLQGFGVIGVNAIFSNIDDLQITTVAQPEGVENGFFSAGNYTIGVSFARSLTDRFSIGFNTKYIDEHIMNSKATAIAFDVGTLFTTQFNGLQIGMSISNYGSKMKMSGNDLLVQHDIDQRQSGNNPNINANLATDEFDLPLIFRVGVSMDMLQGAANSNLILAVDALHPNNNAESLNLGMEYVLNQTFRLRGGYNTLFLPDGQSGLSLGAGLTHQLGDVEFAVDYAYRDFGLLEDIQMFTFQLMF